MALTWPLLHSSVWLWLSILLSVMNQFILSNNIQTTMLSEHAHGKINLRNKCRQHTIQQFRQILILIFPLRSCPTFPGFVHYIFKSKYLDDLYSPLFNCVFSSFHSWVVCWTWGSGQYLHSSLLRNYGLSGRLVSLAVLQMKPSMSQLMMR